MNTLKNVLILSLNFALIFTTFTASASQGFQSTEVSSLPPVETVGSVDLNKYLGTWYEIASIPQWFQKKCDSNTQAAYSLDSDGKIVVSNSCKTKEGLTEVAEGRAKVVDTVTNSKLKVTFVKFFGWCFLFGGNYWIIDLPADYSYVVVGDPSRGYAWILSRTPALSGEKMILAEAALKKQGYDTCQLLTSLQDGGLTERRPLCEHRF
jgi:apolipoprotein D and lipocalin family protein